MSSGASVACPICKTEVFAEPRTSQFPFCSQRCKMVDLGRWMNGEYAVDMATGQLDIIDPNEAEDVTEIVDGSSGRKPD